MPFFFGCQKEEIKENTNPFEGIYVGTSHSIKDVGVENHPDNIDTTYYGSKIVSIDIFDIFIQHTDTTIIGFDWLNHNKKLPLIELW